MTQQLCHGCGAPLAVDQRWCVVCGARRAGARTDALTLLFGEPAAAPAAPPPSGASPLSHAGSRPAVLTAGRRRRAALPVALASLVGLVVVTGSNVPASLAGMSQPPFTVVLPAQVAAQVAQAPPAAAPAPLDDSYDETPLDETPVAEAPVDEAPAADPDTPAEETPAAEDPPVETPAESSPIKHVFLIVLGSTDVAALAQDATAAPYLAGTLVKSGTLLSDYRTVARGSLANRIALVSGQGPTPQTLADCTTFADVRPADALADGQTGGDGCLYGYETGTIGDQLRALERTWKAYVEPAAGASRAAARAASAPQAHAAAACRTDAQTTRRNPFLWFRGTVEADDCDTHNVPLSQLASDLKDSETTPALSYVASDAQQGSADADRFLERVVPQIQNSLAYANGGLIVITSDQAPPPAPAPPTAPTPETPAPAATPPAQPPATTTPTTPADPPAATTPTTPVEPPVTTPTTPTTTPQDPPTGTTPTTPADPPAAGAARSPATHAATATGPLARAAAAAAVTAPGPSTYPNVGDAAAAGAGVPVGALLISSYTPAGRVDRTPANAFTLLRTLSQIFGVDPLGYAAGDEVEPLPDELFSATP